jgi:hypothetical protein
MPPALFAEAATPLDPFEALKQDPAGATELAESLGLLLFFALGYVVLFLLWGVFRRVCPRKKEDSRVSVAFVVWLFVALVGLPLAWLQIGKVFARLPPFTRADVIVTIHLAFVLGVLLAQVLILVGWATHWEWVRNFWFRLGHLLSIHLVAAQRAIGIHCPLTTWEEHLRGEDWEPLAGASALGRFAHNFLMPDWELGTFLSVYIAFAATVLLTWFFVAPRWPWGTSSEVDRATVDRATVDSSQ